MILRDPDGFRCILSLCWDDGEWCWDYRWLGIGWNAIDPSALLASS